jgi:hypothetical protein
LCLAIVGLEGVEPVIGGDGDYHRLPYQHGRSACHTLVVVSFAAQSELVRSPIEAFWVDVVEEMLYEFWEHEDL